MKKNNERKYFVVKEVEGHNYLYSKGLDFVKPFEKDSIIRKINEVSFKKIEKAIPFNRNWRYLYIMSPEHGDIIKDIDDYQTEFEFATYGTLKLTRPTEKCDAIITEYNLPIGIFPADCECVALIDVKKGIKSLVHSGWRGTLLGILPKTISEMVRRGSKVSDILVIMGPSISKENFEIGEDVIEDFKEYLRKNGILEEYLISYDSGIQKYHVDVNGIIIKQLFEIGISGNNIRYNEWDTFSSKDGEGRYNFHSYRREKSDYRNICILL